jgi:hypothetical protein
MSNLNFTLVSGDKVTDAQLKTCATLFSQNYGIWSSLASSPFKPGVYLRRPFYSVKFLPLVLRYPREDERYSIKGTVPYCSRYNNDRPLQFFCIYGVFGTIGESEGC